MKKGGFSIILIILIILISCNFNAPKSVKIGDQEWMTENLDIIAFRNGDPIRQAITEKEWSKAGENKQPAWCYNNNDPKNGKLYNWYAVMDSRGLAPAGWHIPSTVEWKQLISFLGGDTSACIKIKTPGYWTGTASNVSGFSALCKGYRSSNGSFSNMRNATNWWTSTESSSMPIWAQQMTIVNNTTSILACDKGFGLSVRCLRDQ